MGRLEAPAIRKTPIDVRPDRQESRRSTRTTFAIAFAAGILSLMVGGCRAVPAMSYSCIDPASEYAAALARKQFPNALPPKERREGRNQFLSDRRWELFDKNQDGLLDFDEFLSSEWAGYLALSETNQCHVSRVDFLTRFLGDPNDPLSGWRSPWIVRSMEDLYKSTDADAKGYITKNDIAARTRRAFDFADANHDGKISSDELDRDPPRRAAK